ncbi:MAG TPA: hypothetical protein VLU96_12760 [Gaiellaceae bacterium]|nr:hypothetical protein [Gaiellaceae bacterium]
MVVTVCSAHHIPTQTLEYSLWSNSRIRTPLPATIIAVATTMTLAAVRTDGGSLRNFDVRRSIGFVRGEARTFRPAALRANPARLRPSPPRGAACSGAAGALAASALAQLASAATAALGRS